MRLEDARSTIQIFPARPEKMGAEKSPDHWITAKIINHWIWEVHMSFLPIWQCVKTLYPW